MQLAKSALPNDLVGGGARLDAAPGRLCKGGCKIIIHSAMGGVLMRVTRRAAPWPAQRHAHKQHQARNQAPRLAGAKGRVSLPEAGSSKHKIDKSAELAPIQNGALAGERRRSQSVI